VLAVATVALAMPETRPVRHYPATVTPFPSPGE
jgi:hypothetical protein